jgi:hypothetical protein
MVARHEMPGTAAQKTRPGGYGMIGAPGFVHGSTRSDALGNRIIPCPTGRGRYPEFSRHFVPGYHHSIPTGYVGLAIEARTKII